MASHSAADHWLVLYDYRTGPRALISSTLYRQWRARRQDHRVHERFNHHQLHLLAHTDYRPNLRLQWQSRHRSLATGYSVMGMCLPPSQQCVDVSRASIEDTDDPFLPPGSHPLFHLQRRNIEYPSHFVAAQYAEDDESSTSTPSSSS